MNAAGVIGLRQRQPFFAATSRPDVEAAALEEAPRHLQIVRAVVDEDDAFRSSVGHGRSGRMQEADQFGSGGRKEGADLGEEAGRSRWMMLQTNSSSTIEY